MGCVVVSYDTFVGIALESDSESPYRDGATGTGTAFDGTAPTELAGFGASAPTIFLPLAGDESLGINPNYQDLPQPEGNPYLSKTQSFGAKVEGSLPVILPPGVLVLLKSWLFDRGTVLGCTNQLASATVWVNIGGTTCKRFVGVKVGSADFQIQKTQAVQLNLNCVGFGEHRVNPISFSAPTWWQHAVYGGDSIALEIPTGTTERDSDALNFTINNMLDDDPHRLWSSNYPRRLWTRNREVTGSFARDYVDEANYTKFLAGTLGSITATLAKTIASTTYTNAFVFPTIQYRGFTGVNAKPNKDTITKENLDWRALGNPGVTADMTWTLS
jgi:hypothetical protein